MKVGVDCALCLFKRGYAEILEATRDKNLRLKALRALFKLLAEQYVPSAIPADIGTMRERLIKEVTGNPDPYARKKKLSNKAALKAVPIAEKIISQSKGPEERFRKACLCAIVGNIMEFDIPGHEPDFGELEHLILNAEDDLVIDEISKAYNLIKKSRTVLYLTDNAGEIAFDTLLVREIRNLGSHVVVAVKGGNVYNDATLVDAFEVGMDKVAHILITTGTDSIGLSLEESSLEFRQFYYSADFIVAKGMGYAETITEIEVEKPHLLLLRTKCDAVAQHFGVKRHKNVAKVLLPK